MSAKPRVKTIAARGPLRSISALVTTVVACTIAPPTSAGVSFALASTAWTPSKKPRNRSSGVVRVFSTNRFGPARSTTSVNVPPMSTASATSSAIGVSMLFCLPERCYVLLMLAPACTGVKFRKRRAGTVCVRATAGSARSVLRGSERHAMARVKQSDQREGRVQALDLALRMLEQLAFTGKPGTRYRSRKVARHVEEPDPPPPADAGRHGLCRARRRHAALFGRHPAGAARQRGCEPIRSAQRQPANHAARARSGSD